MTGKITHRPTRGGGLTDQFDTATSIAATCAGKEAFASRAEAKRIIDIRRQRCRRGKKGKRAEVAKIEAYQCKHCRQWHHGMGVQRR